jgi:hypothetical protein
MLKQIRFVIVASIILCAVCSVYALYEVTNKGTWPKNWPKELEPLRKQARTSVHSQKGAVYEIVFTSRAQFEAAWPHILTVKSKKAPLTLLSSPDGKLGETIKAGVRILSPLTGTFATPKGLRYPPGALAISDTSSQNPAPCPNTLYTKMANGCLTPTRRQRNIPAKRDIVSQGLEPKLNWLLMEISLI